MSGLRDTCVRRGALQLCLATLLLVPSPVGAQAVVDAGIAEFAPSSDHARAAADGTPIVTSYQLQVFPAGSTQLLQTADLGKPAPQTDGLIRIAFLNRLASPLAGGVQYQARVAAVGPGGTSASELSNIFSYSLSCSPAVSPTSASIAASGGSGSSTVTVAAGCAWSATSGAAWLTITSGASGSGTGAVSFNATANSATSPRTGTLTIAGQTFTVTQAAACTYAISPGSRTSPAAGETTSVGVTAGSTCAWTATSNAAWLTVTGGASGTGNGTTAITVAPNSATTTRSGTLTIAGQTFTVAQAGTPCTYTVSPSTIAASAAGLAGTTSVTTGTGCVWTVTGVPSWMTVTTGTQSGSGAVSFSIAANTKQARSATLVVAGQSVAVSQESGVGPLAAPGNLRVKDNKK